MPKGPQLAGAAANVAEPTGDRRPPTGHRCLRLNEVCRRVGLGETCIRTMIGRGEFPAPFKIGARAVGWLETDVEAWIEARVAKRVIFKAYKT
jgi:prophage regulatory protein